MSPLDRFAVYGERVCPFYNYFQPALVLLEHDAIDARAALRVAAELVIDQSFTADALTASYFELARRGQAGAIASQRVRDEVAGIGETEFAVATPTLRAFADELARVRVPSLPPMVPEPIDYVALLARERSRAKAAKLRVLNRS
jgi:DICT domain-containing protein